MGNFVFRDIEWQERAACRDVDTDLFFSPEGERGLAKVRRIRAAKAICALCIVGTECYEFAISIDEQYGVWGGEVFEGRRPA